MTRFINPPFPALHHGAERIESVGAASQQARQALSSLGNVGLLRLGVISAALMAMAYGVLEDIEDGHWLVMWMLGFAALLTLLALLGPVARSVASAVKGSLDAWSWRRAQGRADQRLWALAQQDPRIMADLQLAFLRNEAVPEAAQSTAARPGWRLPEVKLTAFMAQAYTRGDYI